MPSTSEEIAPKKTLTEINALLAKAADNLHPVVIRYHKEGEKAKGYLVEPYSYRGDKFFGYDIDAETIKGFALLRIEDVKIITCRNFKPRWPVEIKS